jgi:hypothetical protein
VQTGGVSRFHPLDWIAQLHLNPAGFELFPCRPEFFVKPRNMTPYMHAQCDGAPCVAVSRRGVCARARKCVYSMYRVVDAPVFGLNNFNGKKNGRVLMHALNILP